ncbi:MAG: CpaF family protein [Euryarchaeota archaeon]|jgi:flagellar protein FlaI|nr:CpaF family protein [Euryarchaeota archaeon]MBT3972029.1 CpaF family protein [Euryarchaeota archaeon]MBT4406512.1 CpaF family protein [Euryarchaeota archaeon]MBT6645774.1 CpaF family protein [Euryarchaeota archaeon]
MTEEKILAQYGNITIYSEPNHPSPIYHYEGDIPANPYGKIQPLFGDDDLEEVMYNGGQQCVKVAHRKFGICRTNIWVEDEEGLAIAKNIASFTSVPLGDGPGLVPIFDGRLPDGSRVNGTIPPVTPDGPTLTIRKFKEDPFTMIDLVKFGTVNLRLAAMMWVWIDGLDARPANFVIAGGTGSGKTTTLNCLGMYIPWDKRLLTVEDTAELQVYHDHWLRMETRRERPDGTAEVDMNDCLKSSLRMRPDRIIVGEVRGPECATLLTAMNTGHDGSFGSLHANTGAETITRMINPPMNVPPIMLSGLDLIIIQARLHVQGKTVRKITEVSEVAGMEGDKPRLNAIWKYDAAADEIKETGIPSKLREKICDAAGVTPAEFEKHVQQRMEIIRNMLKRDISDIQTVTQIIQGFYSTR